MTSHCGLEKISGLSFLACAPEAESAPHQPSDCGDDDSCDTVESGLYKSEEKQILVAKPVIAAAFALLAACDLEGRDAPPSAGLSEVAPPGLAQFWQFSLRTALPPRPPSLL